MKRAIETDLSKAIQQYHDARGIPLWRNNSFKIRLPNADGTWRMLRAGFVGASDRIGLLPGRGGGRFLAIEVKLPACPLTKRRRQKLTDDQLAFLEAVNAAGGAGYVVHDLVEAGRYLDHALAGGRFAIDEGRETVLVPLPEGGRARR